MAKKEWMHLHRNLHSGRGLRNRWLRNSFLLVSMILLAIVVILSVVISRYYYNAMLSGIETKVQTVSDFFASYATTESEYQLMAEYYVTDFDEKDRLELQFLTVEAEPSVFLSSSGLTSGSKPDTQDITAAISTGGIAHWIGRDPATRERIMAVSAPIISNGEVKGVLRMVTGLRLLDRQVAMMIAAFVTVALFVMALTYLVNTYFVRTIINPIASITEIAKRIASGYYGIQLEKQYDDEIGDLVDAINDMSTRISQNEQMKSEFISSVSHELRTPLTAINGWGETLISGKLTDAQDFKKGLNIIVSESRRLTKMVEELLEFSRIEDGRFTLNIEMIDIQAEFEDAVYTYREFFKKEGITLNYTDPQREFAPLPGDPERALVISSRPPSGRRMALWPLSSGITARASRRRSCPTSRRSSTKARPRPGATASAWQSATRLSSAMAAGWISPTPRTATAAWSPFCCP